MTQADAVATAGGVWPRLAMLSTTLAGLSGWRRLAVTAGLGALATFSAPPAYVVPVLFIAFPGLLWILQGVSSRRAAFMVGWTFGFGFFVPGLYWIAFALTVDLAAFWWLIPFAVAGLPAILAIFVGAAILALHMLPLDGLPRVLAFAALWGVAEWLRGHMFTGFPWQLVGYGWVAWGPVLQSVSAVGIYGLSLLTVLVTALPAALVRADDGRVSRAGQAACIAGLGLFVAIAGAGALRLTDGVGDVPGVRLRLVQPNISQADKWDRQLAPQHFAMHLELSRTPAPIPVTHIFWPETAVPYALEREPAIRQALADATPAGGLTVTGTPRFSNAGPRQVWNSLAAVDDSGAVVGTFDKFHLVPFGEYVPPAWCAADRQDHPGAARFFAGTGAAHPGSAGIAAGQPADLLRGDLPGRGDRRWGTPRLDAEPDQRRLVRADRRAASTFRHHPGPGRGGGDPAGPGRHHRHQRGRGSVWAGGRQPAAGRARRRGFRPTSGD